MTIKISRFRMDMNNLPIKNLGAPTVSTDAARLQDAGASVVRSSRTSDTILGTADKGYLIDVTSGTFTQTFTAAATLGSGWFVYYGNSGTGFVTLDPNGAETITVNGSARSTWTLWPREMGLITCDGTGLYYYCIQKGEITQTISSSVTSVSFATGLAYRRKLLLTWTNVAVDVDSQISLYLNTSVSPDKNAYISVRATTAAINANAVTTDSFTLGTTHASTGTGANSMHGEMRFNLDTARTVAIGSQWYYNPSGPTPTYGTMNLYWTGISESSITDITIAVQTNKFTSGVFILREI